MENWTRQKVKKKIAKARKVVKKIVCLSLPRLNLKGAEVYKARLSLQYNLHGQSIVRDFQRPKSKIRRGRSVIVFQALTS